MKSRRFLKMIAVATTLVASSLLSSTAFAETKANWDFTQASGQTNDTVNSYNLTTGGTIDYNTTTGANFGAGYNKLTFDHADLNPKNAGAGNTWVLDITGQKFNVDPVGDTYHAIWGQRSSTEDLTGLWIYKYKNADSVANKYQVWYGTGTGWGKLTPNVIPQLGSTYDLRISYDVTTDTLSFGVSTDGGDFETVTSPSGCNLTFATGDNSFNFGYIEKYPSNFAFNGTIKSASISVNAPAVEVDGFDETVFSIDGGTSEAPLYADLATARAALPATVEDGGVDVGNIVWSADSTPEYTTARGVYVFTGDVTLNDGFTDDQVPNVPTQVTATIDIKGPSVWFKMNESSKGDNDIMLDSVAGHNGTYGPRSGIDSGYKGSTNGAVAFSGELTTDVTTCPGSADIHSSTFTASCWAKFGSSNYSAQYIFGTRTDAGGGKGWAFYFEGNQARVRCVIADSGGTFRFVNFPLSDLTTNNNFVANGWNHFAYSYDGIVKLYVNGTQAGSDASYTYTPNSADQPFSIGGCYGKTYGLTGSVDDVRLYNYTLSADEVATMYQVYTPAIGLDVVQDGTVVTWTVESQAGVEKYIVTDTAGKEYEVDATDGVTEYSITVENEGEVTLTVVDSSGYVQNFVPADGSIVKTVYDLVKGWNLVAIAGENAEAYKLGTLWGWNGDSYEMVKTPKAAQAVWVHSAIDAQIIVESDKVQAELELNAGWNMVGPTENMAVPAEAHTVYGWTDTYQTIANDGTLLMGVGYWIFCDK